MKTVALLLVTSFMLSGCFLTTAVKYTTDTVCNSTDSEKEVMKEKADKVTAPAKVRVYCDGKVPTDK